MVKHFQTQQGRDSMARHFATRSTRPDDEFYYKSTQWGWVSSIQQRFFHIRDCRARSFLQELPNGPNLSMNSMVHAVTLSPHRCRAFVGTVLGHRVLYLLFFVFDDIPVPSSQIRYCRMRLTIDVWRPLSLISFTFCA